MQALVKRTCSLNKPRYHGLFIYGREPLSNISFRGDTAS
jgi:hypothetical protein